MGWQMLATLGGSALSSIGDWFASNAEKDAAQKNYDMQSQNLAWQKEQQQISWARDDNAVSRRAKDMANAGINPLLAAGSAAGNAPVVHTEAPQMDTKAVARASAGGLLSEGASKAIDALAMSKDFAVKDAQIQNLQSQSRKTDIEANAVETMLPGNVKLQSADIGLKDVQARSLAFDLAQLKPAEVRLKTQQIADSIQDIKHSEWAIRNGDKLTQLQAVRDHNEQMLRSAGVSESAARLAAMAVELEILKSNRDVAVNTVGARSAGAYIDTVKNMDMVKLLGANIGDPKLFRRIQDLLHK